jgi:hypothetical protein
LKHLPDPVEDLDHVFQRELLALAAHCAIVDPRDVRRQMAEPG